MKRFLLFGLTLAVLSLVLLPPARLALAQQQQPTAGPSGQLPAAEVERIVRAFSAKETEFRQALTQYSFKRDATVQTIGMGGQITGEYHRTSRFVFDDKGARFEKIVAFPLPTLADFSVTPEDLEDLGGVNAFALEAEKLGKYDFKYVGKEKIDELDLYVFDVSPKAMPDPKKTKERFFLGRIWVDDQDLQIVKVRGKGVPETKENKFPTFETYRENIDGKYWFPSYTYADEQLVFGNGNVAHVRMRIKFSDYERYKARVRVLDDAVLVDDQKPAPPPAKKKP